MFGLFIKLPAVSHNSNKDVIGQPKRKTFLISTEATLAMFGCEENRRLEKKFQSTF